jgi:integrase
MPRKRLTEEGVAKLNPPKTGQVDYYDAILPGLVLRVNYGGAKVWRALHYIKKVDADGKRSSMPTTHKLGRYPHLKLKDARERARLFLQDPAKAKTQAESGSFREVAENFIKRYVEHEGLRSQYEIERVLKVYIYTRWEHRAFRDIGRADVASLLDQVSDNNGPRQADMCLAIIRKLTNWFATRDDHYVSPIVKGMNRSTNGSRKRILTDDEIRALWKVADGTFGALLRVALLTGQRKDKVATMRWSDVDDVGVWTIAGEEREKANAGRLQLPPMVTDIIEAQPRIASNPHVFAAGKGQGPFNSFSQRKDEIDKRLPKMPGWTIHDLRRTARSLLSRADVRPDIAERVLGHAIAGVGGVYDRHAYADEKGRALVALSALVGRIIDPKAAKVTDINEQRRKRRKRAAQ